MENKYLVCIIMGFLILVIPLISVGDSLCGEADVDEDNEISLREIEDFIFKWKPE